MINKRRLLRIIKEYPTSSEPPKYSDKLKEAIWTEWSRIEHLPKECYDYKYGLSLIARTLKLLDKLTPTIEYRS